MALGSSTRWPPYSTEKQPELLFERRFEMVLRYLGRFLVSFVVSAVCLLEFQYAVGTVELSQL